MAASSPASLPSAAPGCVCSAPRHLVFSDGSLAVVAFARCSIARVPIAFLQPLLVLSCPMACDGPFLVVWCASRTASCTTVVASGSSACCPFGLRGRLAAASLPSPSAAGSSNARKQAAVVCSPVLQPHARRWSCSYAQPEPLGPMRLQLLFLAFVFSSFSNGHLVRVFFDAVAFNDGLHA